MDEREQGTGAGNDSRGVATLVLGGTRSGKSALAEDLASRSGPVVTYVATAAVDATDPDHLARIDQHQDRRPDTWRTVECTTPDLLAPLVASIDGPVLLDSLGSWLASSDDLSVDVGPLTEALASRSARGLDTIIVSEETGWTIGAPTELGRNFIDAIGQLNQAVAAASERVLLVVAGRAIEIPRWEPSAAPDAGP